MMIPVTIQCPLCNDTVEKLVYRFHLDSERQVIAQLKSHNPSWQENDGACGRCVDYYHTEVVMQQRILPEIGPFFPVKSVDDFIILPTALRLEADLRYTGKGITICFIDSGFYLHPDLISHNNRVKRVIDFTVSNRADDYFFQPHDSSWHGTMTSVVCAGDGYASNGLYKGIASGADLVLLKVQNDEGRITTGNIVKALTWILANHLEYNIRIVNISIGGDELVSYNVSEIDNYCEQLIAAGINVIAAAGNDERGLIKPPANSPGVITVGGLDDENSLEQKIAKLYHSTFGRTIDGFMKPELVAHAIWLSAPIVPGTREKKEAELLHGLLQLNDNDLKNELVRNFQDLVLDNDVCRSDDISFIRQSIINRIQEAKYISPAYMHVDGTSFAAPIVSAVVAQLLEANPALTPAHVKEILFTTARRIDNLPAERQGYGAIQPRQAILKILKREIVTDRFQSPFIDTGQKTIEFYIQRDCATQVSLSGSFNDWARDVLLLEPGKNGIWKITIPLLPAGRYHYKFFIDDKIWVEDVGNPYREPDGFNGFNSLLLVEEKQL